MQSKSSAQNACVSRPSEIWSPDALPIEITAGRPDHLFHALDPSPLVGREVTVLSADEAPHQAEDDQNASNPAREDMPMV